tara:strand:+ start:248 stop:556 length:309 start_codon:yes stop_codon:yes gene_type:complete
MKIENNTRMKPHRKNHILFEIDFKCHETLEVDVFSVAMGFPNEWSSNVMTPNNNTVDIDSTDLNVVKKFCELVANKVISDTGELSGFDEKTINVLNVPTEKE